MPIVNEGHYLIVYSQFGGYKLVYAEFSNNIITFYYFIDSTENGEEFACVQVTQQELDEVFVLRTKPVYSLFENRSIWKYTEKYENTTLAELDGLPNPETYWF